MMSWGALKAIDLYQRHLSPRKGYRCAFSVLHGGTGCSGYAKSAIRASGFVPALPLIRARFADCKAAAVTLSAKRGTEGSADRRRAARKSRWYDCCDPAGCGVFANPSCKSGDCNADCGPCDCSP